MWNLKSGTDGPVYKTDTDVENKFMVTKGGKGKNKLGDWDWHKHTTIYKTDNKNLFYSTGNSAQCSAVAHMGKESKIRDTCVCIAESLWGTHETNTTL